MRAYTEVVVAGVGKWGRIPEMARRQDSDDLVTAVGSEEEEARRLQSDRQINGGAIIQGREAFPKGIRGCGHAGLKVQ